MTRAIAVALAALVLQPVGARANLACSFEVMGGHIMFVFNSARAAQLRMARHVEEVARRTIRSLPEDEPLAPWPSGRRPVWSVSLDEHGWILLKLIQAEVLVASISETGPPVDAWTGEARDMADAKLWMAFGDTPSAWGKCGFVDEGVPLSRPADDPRH